MNLKRSALHWLAPAGLILIALVLGIFAWREYTKSEVVVEWTTASELSTAGYNLYRSGLKDGNYEKVNDELIPASPDPLTGGKYTYLDDRVDAGTTYYYQLEDVESDGSTSRYGPIEVQAYHGGVTLIVISLFLFVTGLFVIVYVFKHRNVVDEPPSE